MFDMDMWNLFFSITFSVIGLGYCAHGRKHSLIYTCTGIGLLVFPYFISGFWWMVAIGLLLSVLPLVLDR